MINRNSFWLPRRSMKRYWRSTPKTSNASTIWPIFIWSSERQMRPFTGLSLCSSKSPPIQKNAFELPTFMPPSETGVRSSSISWSATNKNKMTLGYWKEWWTFTRKRERSSKLTNLRRGWTYWSKIRAIKTADHEWYLNRRKLEELFILYIELHSIVSISNLCPLSIPHVPTISAIADARTGRAWSRNSS